jgi:hypothetical protein
MAEIYVAVESDLSPAVVLGAAVDFSERRLQVWPGIDPAVYKVERQGEGCALVVEGTDVLGGVWARELYEWPIDAGVVRATIQESNTFVPGGTWELRATPTAEGSHVEIEWHRQGRGLKGRVVTLGMRLRGRKRLTDGLEETLRVLHEPGMADAA